MSHQVKLVPAAKPVAAGVWCIAFDRRGRQIRMFVPNNTKRVEA
jgi:hypothetical protein